MSDSSVKYLRRLSMQIMFSSPFVLIQIVIQNSRSKHSSLRWIDVHIQLSSCFDEIWNQNRRFNLVVLLSDGRASIPEQPDSPICRAGDICWHQTATPFPYKQAANTKKILCCASILYRRGMSPDGNHGLSGETEGPRTATLLRTKAELTPLRFCVVSSAVPSLSYWLSPKCIIAFETGSASEYMFKSENNLWIVNRLPIFKPEKINQNCIIS